MIAAILLSGAAIAASAAGLQASWVVPPSAAAPKADDALAGVDPSGTAWLVLDGRIVSAPEKGVVMVADRPVQQLAWIDARPVVRSFDALGTFVSGPDGPRFKPLAMVPLTSWRMAPAGAANLLVAGYNPRKKASQVALVGPAAGGKALKVLYETQARIADVAGDGESAYFASGPAIWKVGDDGTASVFFSSPRTITSLAAAPDGLYYTTDAGIGFAGKTERFEVLRRPGCRIAARGEDLYVLLDGLRGGLLRLRSGPDGRLAPHEQGDAQQDQGRPLMRDAEDDGDAVQQGESPERDLRGRDEGERVERRRRAPR